MESAMSRQINCTVSGSSMSGGEERFNYKLPSERRRASADNQIAWNFSNERERWRHSQDFVVTCVAVSMSAQHVAIIVLRMREPGGFWFVLFLGLSTALIEYPLLLVRCNMCQFTRRSFTACWDFCPAIRGVGVVYWLLSVIALLGLHVDLALLLVYAANSMMWSLPWTDCSNPWNSEYCMENNQISVGLLSSKANMSIGLLKTSADEYWNLHIAEVGSDSGANCSVCMLDHSLQSINLIRFIPFIMICLAIYVPFLLLQRRLPIQLIYISIIFSILVLLGFAVVAVTFKKTQQSITILFSFHGNFDFVFIVNAAYLALSNALVRLSMVSVFASKNHFFYQVKSGLQLALFLQFLWSLFFALVLTVFLSTFLTNYRLADTELCSHYDIIFVVVPFLLSTKYIPQVLCFLYFFHLILLQLVRIFLVYEVIYVSLVDLFPQMLRKPGLMAIVFLSICTLLISSGSIFHVRCGLFLLQRLRILLFDVVPLPIIWLESFCYLYLYGWQNIHRDCHMMYGPATSFSINILMFLVFPLLLTLTTVQVELVSRLNPYDSSMSRVIDSNTSTWAWLDMLQLVPVLTGALLTLVTSVSADTVNPSSALRYDKLRLLTTCFRPSPLWGPGERRMWMFHPYFKLHYRMITHQRNVVSLQQLPPLRKNKMLPGKPSQSLVDTL